MRFFMEVILLVSCASGGEGGGPADAIFTGGMIHTVHPDRPRAEALAARGGRILAVGRAGEILVEHQGAKTRLIDLGGRCVVPGLIDAHAHFLGLGEIRRQIDGRSARSFERLLEMVREKVTRAKPGEWILGRGWDQSLWGEKEFPTHHRLSEVSPKHPVLLYRVAGHAALANRLALRLAGITGKTPNPPGGEILKDGNGQPTGILVDRAIGLIQRVIPERRAPLRELALEAQKACFRVGLTGIHDMGVSLEDAAALQKLAEEGVLKIRLYIALSGGNSIIETISRTPPRIGEGVTIRAVKLFLDGALGSRGAWLLEPYNDRPLDDAGRPYVGLRMVDPKFIRDATVAALRNGYQICVHAIGDRANREALNAYQEALEKVPARDHRLRIEHCQCMALEDIPRFARLGIIPSMQPSHATTDMRWAEDRLGKERLRGAYAWRRFLREGLRIAGGSDFPVEDENPLLGIYAAVTRRDPGGQPEGGWLPDQKMTREEALRAFTIDAARAAFEEGVKGSLEPGKYADFVVLSKDILSCSPREILATRVEMTVVGGEVVYRK